MSSLPCLRISSNSLASRSRSSTVLSVTTLGYSGFRPVTTFGSGIARDCHQQQHQYQYHLYQHPLHYPQQRRGISTFVSQDKKRFMSTKQSISNMASKITDWVKPNDPSGEYKRQVSSFRSSISSAPGSAYPPEAGRYHLYVSYACPWAHRTLITRRLKHLEDVISFSVVHWHLADGGWRFVSPNNEHDVSTGVLNAALNVVPDPIKDHEGFTHLRDIYLESDPDYADRVTVPVLYDTKTRTVVSNESSEILRMLNSEFNALITDPSARALDLYPTTLREQIDAVEAWHYPEINNGVYKTGFATTQEAYERNAHTLFSALDRVEAHFASLPPSQKFWFPGDAPTEVDVRLYVTMIRFDPVYVQHFKCNVRDVRSGYPRIHAWMRNLYWNYGDSFGEGTTVFEHIKKHYTVSHRQINPHGIVPIGPVPDVLPLDGEVAAVAEAKKA